MTKPRIEPTVGRVVYFIPDANDVTLNQLRQEQPLAAIVCHVHPLKDGEDFQRVNLSVFNPFGAQAAKQRVPLVQPDQTPPNQIAHCHWMPYQVAQVEGPKPVEVPKPAVQPAVQPQNAGTQQPAKPPEQK